MNMNALDSSALQKVIAASIGGVGSLLYLAVIVISLVAMWRIFEKADRPGWASLIPFYNTYCLFEMTFGVGWLFLLMLIPCVNLVIAIMYIFKLAKAFGHGIGFGFGLLFLSPIFMLILAFDNSEYLGPQ